MLIQQIMHLGVGYQEPQPVYLLKALVGNVITPSYTVIANGRLIDDLHGNTGFNICICTPGKALD